MTKLGQGVEVGAHHPNPYILLQRLRIHERRWTEPDPHMPRAFFIEFPDDKLVLHLLGLPSTLQFFNKHLFLRLPKKIIFNPCNHLLFYQDLQSGWNSFGGDVVLDSVNVASGDEDSILEWLKEMQI